MTDPTTPRWPLHQSPPYPIFDLQTAIEKAQRFFAAQRKNAIDRDTSVQSPGYSTNSRGKRVLTTVMAFGLLEEPPGGKTPQGKLSALGLRILRQEGDAAQQTEDLQAAALMPPDLRQDGTPVGGGPPQRCRDHEVPGRREGLQSQHDRRPDPRLPSDV